MTRKRVTKKGKLSKIQLFGVKLVNQVIGFEMISTDELWIAVLSQIARQKVSLVVVNVKKITCLDIPMIIWELIMVNVFRMKKLRIAMRELNLWENITAECATLVILWILMVSVIESICKIVRLSLLWRDSSRIRIGLMKLRSLSFWWLNSLHYFPPSN